MENERVITVKGIGAVTVPVDYIEIELSLNETNKDYKKGYDVFEKKISDIQNTIIKCGFNEDDLKTSDLNVKPNYDEVKKGGRYVDVLQGYNFITEMKLRFDFDSVKLNNVFTAITQSKAAPKINVNFTVKDKEKVKKTLLVSSAKDAKEKAEILCMSLGVKLGNIKTINYNWDEIKIYSPTSYCVNDEGWSGLCNREVPLLGFTPDDIRVKDDASFVWEITD